MADTGKRLSAAQREAVVRDLKNTRLRQEEIAEKHGIARRTVGRYAQRYLTPKRLAERTAVNVTMVYRTHEQWKMGEKYWEAHKRRVKYARKAAMTKRQKSDAKYVEERYGDDDDKPM